MLIDKERKYSGSTNLGPETPRQECSPNANDQAEEKDEGEAENELLMMAGRDKRGNAKDPDRPFRAAAQRGLWRGGVVDDDNDDIGGGPGNPPLVF